MPRVKGLRLPKIKAQPPVTSSITPLKGGPHRRRKAISQRVTWYSGYIGATSSLAIVSERAASELRSYRRDIAMCEKDICSCYCRCHTGDVCDGPIDRVHTPGHKTISVMVPASDSLAPCEEDGFITRHRHIVSCHDRVDQTQDPRHIRKA